MVGLQGDKYDLENIKNTFKDISQNGRVDMAAI